MERLISNILEAHKSLLKTERDKKRTEIQKTAVEAGRQGSGAQNSLLWDNEKQYLLELVKIWGKAYRDNSHQLDIDVGPDGEASLKHEITAYISSEFSIIKSEFKNFLKRGGMIDDLAYNSFAQKTLDEILPEAKRQAEMIVDMAKKHYTQTARFQNPPIVPPFDFVTEKLLIPILKRDYEEVLQTMQAKCWKAAIILCGSSIEGILYDLLKQHETNALSLRSAPKTKKNEPLPLDKWGLADLIDAAAELGLVAQGMVSFSHSVREFRNLVHPARELLGTYSLEQEEAEAAFASLKMLVRDLSNNAKIQESG